jgi:hypothetical protein
VRLAKEAAYRKYRDGGHRKHYEDGMLHADWLDVMRTKLEWNIESKRAKNDYFFDQAEVAREANKRGDISAFHNTFKSAQLERSAKTGCTKICNKEGKMVTSETDKLEAIKQHHQGVLGTLEGKKRGDINEVECTVDKRKVEKSLDRCISKNDVRRALKRMKLNRAVGIDDIPTEVLRIIADSDYDDEFGSAAFDLLMVIMNRMHDEGVVPSEYKDTILVNLYKKGDPTDTNNYRGIALMSHVGKVLAKVYAMRLDLYVEEHNILPEEQCGFRRGRSTTDMMLVSRFLTEQAHLHKVDMFQIFVDLTKAYDSVDRGLMWMILDRIGVPPKMRKAITNMHDGMKARVRVDGNLSDSFEMVHGLRQGCVLAPLLFNIFFAFVVKHARESLDNKLGENQFGVQIRHREGSTMFDSKKTKSCITATKTTNVWIALFADDAALMTNNEEELQPMMDAFHAAATAFGLTISIKKTEVLAEKDNVVVTVEGQTLKVVKKFKYLGGMQVPDGSSTAEILKRIQSARNSFIRHKDMFRSKAFTWDDKANLYETHVMSVLLYGCGTWTTNKRMWQKLTTMHIDHLLTMCCKSRRDHISYARLLVMFNMDANIEARVRDCRLRQVQRILDMPRDRLPRIVSHFTLYAISNCRIGNASQWKKSVWQDVVKFGYAERNEKRTSTKNVAEPLWSAKLTGKIPMPLPGTSNTWNPSVREQRDAVFMEIWHTIESKKSQTRDDKRQQQEQYDNMSVILATPLPSLPPRELQPAENDRDTLALGETLLNALYNFS